MASTSRPISFGGVGSTLTVDDVLRVASGTQVSLDPAGLERARKKGRPGGDAAVFDAAPSSATDLKLTGSQVRAVEAVRLLTLIKGGMCAVGVEALAAWLNSGYSPAIRREGDDENVLGALAESFTKQDGGVVGEGAGRPVAVQFSKDDVDVFQSGASPSAGIGALAVQGGKMLVEVATGVAALSCEVLGADVRCLEVEKLDSSPYKSALDAADDVRCLLEGSSLINPRKGGTGASKGVVSIATNHGSCKDALNAASTAIRTELSAASLDAASIRSGAVNAGVSPVLANGLANVGQCALKIASSGLARLDLLLDRLPGLKPSTGGKPAAENENQNGNQELENTLKQLQDRLKPRLDALRKSMEECMSGLGEVLVELATSDKIKGVKVALMAEKCTHLLRNSVALESVLVVLSLRALEGPAPAASDPPPEVSDKKAKKKKKAKGMVVGKGTGVLRSAIETRLAGLNARLDDGERRALEWPFAENVLDVSLVDAFLDSSTLFDPLQGDLPVLADLTRSLIEANQVQRKPKIAKGTRDFMPDQMQIREQAFEKITSVFKRHGAVSIDTPVFELRETLMGKYGEDSKLIYDLSDQGGEILSLRYDLTVPFARFVALHGVGNIKRYHIGKVYRRDQPQMNRGRFREFFQCDFDIAGSYSVMVPDAEVLTVLVEILTDLDLGEFVVKLNHRKLLDATMAIAGVPPNKFRTICSAIDKLDKETWEAVRCEMVEEKGLSEEVADKVGEFVKFKGAPMELLETLSSPENELMQNPDSKAALDEMRILFDFLAAMGSLDAIAFDLSLARGLDYYSGVIYEAVLRDSNVGSIAAGGRYDKLVGMFSGKDVPAVGVSIGIERVFSIMETQLRAKAEESGVPIRAAETQVLVASIGNGMQKKRMEICAELWAAGIKAEFGFKPNPKMGDQLNYVLDGGIPFMVLFGGDELEKGLVKIKNLAERIEEEVERANLAAELKKRLGSR
ncbi:hypothetical protein BSKO_06495 [Bryopsis sp. KO-2023]|nr:hypothetical protein BSKO_06495 [Bryopsis sp. KO-2023]